MRASWEANLQRRRGKKKKQNWREKNPLSEDSFVLFKSGYPPQDFIVLNNMVSFQNESRDNIFQLPKTDVDLILHMILNITFISFLQNNNDDYISSAYYMLGLSLINIIFINSNSPESNSEYMNLHQRILAAWR